MKQLIWSLSRGIVILGSALSVATVANIAHHKEYWGGTIKRVQTTDFNMLAHSLPTKLSYALLKGNTQEVQRTLNSNYGLFGLVVTNCTTKGWECPDQEILYITESKLSWRENLTLEKLRYHPFDFLRDPPPIEAEVGFSDSRDQSWDKTGERNSGQIIGRVYYIRGIPPSFVQSYLKWLQKLPGSLLSDSGAQKYYALTVGVFGIGGTAAWGLLEWGLYRRRMKEQQFQEKMQDVQQRLDQTQEELQNQLEQISGLLAERMQHFQQLEQYQQDQDSHVTQLNQTIAQLEAQLATEKTLINSALLAQTQATLQAKIQDQEQAIALLQQAIHVREQNNSQNHQVIDELNQRLTIAVEQFQQSQATMNSLHQQMAAKEQEHRNMLTILKQWRSKAEVARQRELEGYQQREAMQQSLAELRRQKEELESQIKESDLNEFEKTIFNHLQRTKQVNSAHWRIYPSKDVRRGRGLRQFVDCLIFARSCVVVVEAKNYAGRIEARGEAKLTEWFCTTGSQRIKINSCHGCNPYEQVNTYVNSVMGRLSSAMNQRQVGVYSIVVFPDDTDLSLIKPEVDGSYVRVLRLSEVVPTLQEFEEKALSRLERWRSPLSAQQIEDLIFRRPKHPERN